MSEGGRGLRLVGRDDGDKAGPGAPGQPAAAREVRITLTTAVAIAAAVMPMFVWGVGQEVEVARLTLQVQHLEETIEHTGSDVRAILTELDGWPDRLAEDMRPVFDLILSRLDRLSDRVSRLETYAIGGGGLNP